MKILFKTRAGQREIGEKIFLNGYKKPFKVISKNSNQVIVSHVITGAKLYLSPGWPCLYDNAEMKETLGLV